jgi:phage terminase large subunit-like protein
MNNKSDKVIQFIESLTLSGDYAGKPFILRDWQKDILRKLFDTCNEDGTRQYREAGIWLPRKNAKTELAAGIACYFLMCDPNQGEIYSAASEREQAGIIFKKLQGMIEANPHLRQRCKIIANQKRVINKKTGTLFASLSSVASSQHGYSPSVVIGDELHCWARPDLWTALTTGSATREQPLFISITTAGVYEPESLEWELYNYACKVRDGAIVDPTYLPIIYEIKKGEDWQDEKVWHRVNPALGDFRSLESLRQQARRAKENRRLENDFRRLFLNEHTQQATRWLTMQKWNACANDGPIEKGQQVCGGLDLASTTDIAAWCVCGLRDGGYVLQWKFFIPEERMREIEKIDRVPYSAWLRDGRIIATPGNTIDYDVIRAEIMADADTFLIEHIGYDAWNSTMLAGQLEQEGLSMVKVSQGVGGLSEPSRELERCVIEGKLQHLDDPVAKWMANNCEVYTDTSGNIKPIRPKHGASGKKIDGIVAAIMAIKLASTQMVDDFSNIGALWND